VTMQTVLNMQACYDTCAMRQRERANFCRKCIDKSADLCGAGGTSLRRRAPDTSRSCALRRCVSALRHIVRATEATSPFLLRGPVHGSIVPLSIINFTAFIRGLALGRYRRLKIAGPNWYKGAPLDRGCSTSW
jgi:hypothetical protein